MYEITRDGKKISGVAFKLDVPNQNNRVYPKHVVEKAVQEFHDKGLKRKMLGTTDGQSTGEKIKEAAIVIDDLKIDGDEVICEAEIMDTDSGKNLKILMDKGVSFSFAPAGKGSVSYDEEKGVNYVNDDFTFMAFNVVPSKDASINNVEK